MEVVKFDSFCYTAATTTMQSCITRFIGGGESDDDINSLDRIT